MKKIGAFLLALLLLSLSACTSKREPKLSETEPPVPVEDSALRVSSVEELVEAIRPDAEIIIEPGRYDLMDFLAGFPNTKDRDLWNSAHEYIRIEGTFDGPELIVRNVTGLRIEGGSDDPADTEIVTQPRHATVLGFQDCSDVELACLTIGHTDGGECNGNVLDFYTCQSVRLRNMDLYGCGVAGICTMGDCGDFVVSNSTIRDCALGPFDINEASGPFTFTACTLAGSDSCGGYSGQEGASLSFVDCFFGQEESNRWYWCWDLGLDDSITFEDCEWTEVTEYPDLDPGYEDFGRYVPGFEADAMTEMTFDMAVRSMLNDTYWTGYSMVDLRSGDTYYLDGGPYESLYAESATLFFHEDGSAWLEYRDETLDLGWDVIGQNLACLENAEHTLSVSLYRNIEDPDQAWLLMHYDDDELIWFYR